jgi:hypothetical protein
MKIKDLKPNQIKQLYCSAMGWHNALDYNPTTEKFDEFYDIIEFEWDKDRWTIIGKMAQIQITEDLMFRCGMNREHYGIGGTAFNLKAVFDCLNNFDVL